MKHIKQFSSGGEAVLLMRKTIHALSLYEELRIKGVFNAVGNLRRKIRVGGHIRQGLTQRRTVIDYYPKLKRGRPSNPEVRVLISHLATAFTSVGIGSVTQNQKGQLPLTVFEAFATPILTACEIRDAHGWITKHIADRDKP